MSPDDALANIFFTPEGLADPSPFYRELREQAPVHLSATGALFLSRYEDCREALRDNRLGKSTDGSTMVSSGNDEAAALRREQLEGARRDNRPASMLFLNPPKHTRQRALVARAFTPRRVERLRSSIRVLADSLVDELVDRGEGDVLDLLAFPLPVAVVGTMVGVPAADWPQFRSLISAAAAGLEPTASVEDLQAAGRSGAHMRAYFADLIDQRRTHPQDDLLSDLLQVQDGDDSLSDGEVVAVSMLLFAAGAETTTNLIGNGVVALLQHEQQMEQLWSDPGLVPTAVDETLRWDSPVQLDTRTALEPVSVAGHEIDAGSRVVTLLGSANRDPEQFADPETYDITRDQGPPMSFASGIHYCLGANLARAEGQEVLAALITKCSSIELDGDVTRRRQLALRGFEAVPVKIVGR